MISLVNLNRLFHLISYYIIWFACVYFAGKNQSVFGLTISIGILSLQYLWQYRIAKDMRKLLSFTITLTSCGIAVDSAMSWLHIFIYSDNYFYPYSCPPWLIILWLELSLVTHALLKSLWSRPIFIGLCSFVGFPLAYLFGERLSAITFVYGNWSVILIGLIWMFLFPIIMYSHYQEARKS